MKRALLALLSLAACDFSGDALIGNKRPPSTDPNQWITISHTSTLFECGPDFVRPTTTVEHRVAERDGGSHAPSDGSFAGWPFVQLSAVENGVLTLRLNSSLLYNRSNSPTKVEGVRVNYRQAATGNLVEFDCNPLTSHQAEAQYCLPGSIRSQGQRPATSPIARPTLEAAEDKDKDEAYIVETISFRMRDDDEQFNVTYYWQGCPSNASVSRHVEGKAIPGLLIKQPVP